ncbi:unnamed protein product, partial [Heterotrigona itama]
AGFKKCKPFRSLVVINCLPKLRSLILRNQWHVSLAHFLEWYLHHVGSKYSRLGIVLFLENNKYRFKGVERVLGTQCSPVAKRIAEGSENRSVSRRMQLMHQIDLFIQ